MDMSKQRATRYNRKLRRKLSQIITFRFPHDDSGQSTSRELSLMRCRMTIFACHRKWLFERE
jgi:hypothetical protein